MILLLALGCSSDVPVAKAEPAPASRATTPLALRGTIHEAKEISGGALFGDALYLVADEGGAITRLRRADDGFDADGVFPLPSTRTDADGTELDLEALCAHDGGMIAVGSHSAKRKKLKDDKSHAKNLERLATVEAEPARRVVLPLTADARGVVSGAPIPVFDGLAAHPVLGGFVGRPAKENGIDIEAAACTPDTLTLGFRGPILRGNLVPVARFAIPSGALREVRYVDLAGQAIRDMVAVPDGYLLLTGPMGDAPAQGAIVHWDGADCLPGKDRAPCGLRVLERWPARPDGAKAETLILESVDPLQVVVVWEGKPEATRRVLD